MRIEIVQLEFFPDEVPTPVGEKKRHNGLIQTRMGNGYVKSRPDPVNTYEYFEYNWYRITQKEFNLINRFCKKYSGLPVCGWRHPGLEGDWSVIIPAQASCLLEIHEEGKSKKCDCSVAIRIYKAGGL